MSVCVAFGSHQSISDYPIEPRWLLGLCRAIVDGGWCETEVRCLGLHVATFARLRIRSQREVFVTGFPWSEPLSRSLVARATERTFARWPRPVQTVRS
jgi:hypothetical protein